MSATLRLESVGSIWELDETLMRYRRFPKHEKPRENPEWGGPEAGPMQDFVWHEYVEWFIEARAYDERLFIKLPDGRFVTAPAPIVISNPNSVDTSGSQQGAS